MTFIEYCDNANCRDNDKFRCTAEEVRFDKNAICLTARYEGDSDGTREDTGKKDDWAKDLPGKKNDKWIKYI